MTISIFSNRTRATNTRFRHRDGATKKLKKFRVIRTADFVLKSSIEELNNFKKLILDNEKGLFIQSHLINVSKSHNIKNMKISSDSRRILELPNAGGNSIESESLSLEFLKRLLNAKLNETEMEIEYFAGSKKTDYSIRLDGIIYGVSVTRAFHYRDKKLYNEKMASYLLRKKLEGVIWSSENVLKKSKWKKQILHIQTDSKRNATMLKKCYEKMKKKLKFNTVVVVTICHNCRFIFSNYKRMVKQ